MTTIQYKVSGLGCEACVNRVKNALAEYADDVAVTLNPPIVQLINPDRDIDGLNTILASIGEYQLKPD